METGTIILFVGVIVGACIVGGAIYSGDVKVADAIAKSNTNQS